MTSASAGQPVGDQVDPEQVQRQQRQRQADERRDQHDQRARRRCPPAGRPASCGCCRRCRAPRAPPRRCWRSCRRRGPCPTPRASPRCPVRPMAMPMCASRSAGASLTPSPVIATTAPRAFQSRTMRSLSSGVARAWTTLRRRPRPRRTMPSSRAIARGGDRVVAGDHHRADAGARARRRPPRSPRCAADRRCPTSPSSAQVLLLDRRARRATASTRRPRARHVARSPRPRPPCPTCTAAAAASSAPLT